MIKQTLVLLFISTLFLMGCGGDDENNKDFNYPLKSVFKGITKDGDIQVWTRTNGEIVSVALDQTILDEDEVFTEIGNEGSFLEFIFNSDTEVDLIGEDDLVLDDTTSIIYTCANNTLTFPISFGQIILNMTAEGNPESFDVDAQAYIESDDSGSISLSGAFSEDVESLKNQLEEGSTIAILNYTENYGQ